MSVTKTEAGGSQAQATGCGFDGPRLVSGPGPGQEMYEAILAFEEKFGSRTTVQEPQPQQTPAQSAQ